AAIALLSKLSEGGEDPRHVMKEFLALLRRLLLLAAGAKPDALEADQKRLLALSRAVPYENLLRAVSLAIEADALTRRCDDAGLVLQMLVLRLCELPRLRSVEEALSGPGGSASAAVPAPPRERPRSESQGPRILSLVSVESEGAPSAPPAPASGA